MDTVSSSPSFWGSKGVILTPKTTLTGSFLTPKAPLFWLIMRSFLTPKTTLKRPLRTPKSDLTLYFGSVWGDFDPQKSLFLIILTKTWGTPQETPNPSGISNMKLNQIDRIWGGYPPMGGLWGSFCTHIGHNLTPRGHFLMVWVDLWGAWAKINQKWTSQTPLGGLSCLVSTYEGLWMPHFNL